MKVEIDPIIKQFLTYNSKADRSNTDAHYLVQGSINTLIVDKVKFKKRDGYTLQSIAGTGNAIRGSEEWSNSTSDNFPLRSHFDNTDANGVLELYINGAWETLLSSLTSVDLIFSPYWDNTEKIDRLLWCDGSVNVYDWSGASASFLSATVNTITISGSQTAGQHRFLTTGTRQIRIKDHGGTWRTFTYSGGESTTTLTGVSPDPTVYTFDVGALILQEVIVRSNYISSTFKVDFLKVIDSQVWAGSRTSNSVFVSKNTSIIDFTYSTPRAVGEGAQLNLDSPGRGLGVLKGDVVLFSGESDIYRSQFNQITVGSSLAETLKVVHLKTTARQSAQHFNLIENVGNGLMWIGYDNVLYELLDATLSYNPDLRPVSDPLKTDFDDADFTGGHLKFDRSRLYISAPLSSRCFIYEYKLVVDLQTQEYRKEWFWQPPQTLPVKRWAVIGGDIHGHSSSSSETYKLFDGLNDGGSSADGGKAIHAIAILARWNGNVRNDFKSADEMYNEGYITANTVIDVSYSFDLDGGEKHTLYKTIDGSLPNIIYEVTQDPSLGNYDLGDVSLSGDIISDTTLPKFRIKHEINSVDFFDYDVQFETNDLDQQWEIIATGSNAQLSTNHPTAIGN
jgi:hypothetical protein